MVKNRTLGLRLKKETAPLLVYLLGTKPDGFYMPECSDRSRQCNAVNGGAGS